MLQIEKYFVDNVIDNTIYNKNLDFDISNSVLFNTLIDINMWANDLDYLEQKTERPEQGEFRKLVLNRDKNCIIDPERYIPSECDACHIIEVKDGGTYDIDNGLLINKIHHKSFDDNKWSINPETFCIDILCDNKNIVGSIINYKGNKINIKTNNIMKMYLRKRWKTYLDYKMEYSNKN